MESQSHIEKITAQFEKLEIKPNLELVETLKFLDILEKKYLSEQKEKKESKQLALMKFFQNAKKEVESIVLSANFMVELSFDLHNILTEEGEIEIRTSSKQHRHISPIALVAKIFKSCLKKGKHLNDIYKMLSLKIDIFKISIDDPSMQLIQSVFDYFKNPSHLTSAGMIFLVKILMRFYHENDYLVFRDIKGHELPKLHERFIVPILVKSGKVYAHKNEGSFIKALLGVLDYLEEEANEKNLSQKNIYQLSYTIFALFDFPPLPLNYPKKSSDTHPDERYLDETVERLSQAAAKHLLFVFENYPAICTYKEEILTAFSAYIVKGVSEQNLLTLFEMKTIHEITKQTKTSMSHFIHEYGFSKQHHLTEKELADKINQYLKKWHISHIDSDKSIPEEDLKKEIKVENENDFHLLAKKILFKQYFFSEKSPYKLDEFKRYDVLCVDKDVFVSIFSNTYYSLSTLGNNNTNERAIVWSAIEKAYDSAKIEKKEKSLDSLRVIHYSLSELEQKQTGEKNTDSDNSDSSYAPGGNTSHSDSTHGTHSDTSHSDNDSASSETTYGYHA